MDNDTERGGCMSEIVLIAKATGYANPVPGVVIDISDAIPAFDGDGWEERSREFYQEQGRAMCDAMMRTLPGGTLDELLVALLTRKASFFRVSYEVGAK